MCMLISCSSCLLFGWFSAKCQVLPAVPTWFRDQIPACCNFCGTCKPSSGFIMFHCLVQVLLFPSGCCRVQSACMKCNRSNHLANHGFCLIWSYAKCPVLPVWLDFDRLPYLIRATLDYYRFSCQWFTCLANASWCHDVKLHMQRLDSARPVQEVTPLAEHFPFGVFFCGW